jgi:putative peptide zinc metalloprotease protein
MTALVLAGALGVVAGAVPVASGEGATQTCQSSTSSTQTSTTTSTTNSTPTTTTPPATTTTPAAITLPPPHGHPLNAVTIENCNDGTVKARSHLQVGVASPTNADPGNYAYAYAHDCSTGCEAIAAAFQVALIPQGASRQAPENVALAINYNCDHCGAFAYAYQYAVEVPRGTRLSSATWHQIAAIRREAAADIRANLTFVDLDSRLRALATRLKTDVDTGLTKQHVHETHRHSSQHLKQQGHHNLS